MKENRHFEEDDHPGLAQETVDLYNQHRVSVVVFEANDDPDTCSPSFQKCPVVCDTGALYRLSPFRCDFIDYGEVWLPVQGITHINYIIGIGTIAWKLKATNGDTLYVPTV